LGSVLPVKQTWITLLLNFLFPGAGHGYASDGKEWKRLVAVVVCLILTPILYVTGIYVIFAWIYCLVTSGTVTMKYNGLIAQQQARALAQDRLQIRGANIADQLGRLTSLRKTEILSPQEYAQQKTQLLAIPSDAWTSEDLPTFLGPFAALVTAGQMSQEDLASIKALYAHLPRGPHRP
ncbi:MAG: hypothetical protein WCG85_15140, partial [Polyangia bacterium]